MNLRPSRLMLVVKLSLALLILASSARAERIDVDFAQQTSTSSYLLFGAASPNPKHAFVWPELAKAGVTSLRFGALLGSGADPANITLEDYRANMGRPGSVADINSKHWNWERIDGCLAICREHGLTSVGVISYCPTWLSQNGLRQAPPRDWEVWEDLVKQLLRRYAGRIDYWEIWNEPNGPEFMKLRGTSYAEGKEGMLQAYLDICRHTLAAAEASGVKTPLGGPALATWNSAPFLDGFLAATDVSRQLGFLTHHIYFHTPTPNRCHPPTVRELEKKHGVGPLPLFITEWNCKSGVDERPHPLKNTPEAVSWVGKTFINYLQWGVEGAHFYNFHEGKAIDDQYGGAYAIENGQATLYRYVKVWHLFSRVLGLGEHGGKIAVFATHVEGLAPEETLEPHYLDSLYAVGCRNARGVPVLALANPSTVERMAHIAVKNLPAGTYRAVACYVGTAHAPAEIAQPSLLFERTLAAPVGSLDFVFPVPAHHVVGVRLEAIPPR